MTSQEEAKNIQLKAMLKSGIPLEEACELLSLDFEAARLYLSGDLGKEEDADELIRKYKPRLITLLYNIACDESLENTSARVSAAKVIVDGKGEIPEFSVDKLSEMYKKMKGVVEKAEKTVTVNNPSPQTTTVNVKIPEPLKDSELKKN